MKGAINFLLEKIHNFQGFDFLSKFKKKDALDYTNARKHVGNIIIAVLTERLCVREALLKFPQDTLKDRSIQAAWHALCHYEADEDIKRRDVNYSNEQLELLELMAFTFKDGKDLPQNIISAYDPYYEEALVAPQKGLSAILDRLLRFINI